MSIEVRRLTADDREQWNRLVERSPHGTPFHLREFSQVLAEHTGAQYVPLIGYKGQEPVGLFPAFILTRGPVTTLFSPPPNLEVSYQGPAMVNIEKLKQRKEDRRHQQFVEGCLDLLESEFSLNYAHVRTGWQYLDTRPFVSHEYDTSTSYTYVTDITPDEETLLGQFSSDARQNITGEYNDVTIEEEGVSAAQRIIEQVRERHEAQGEEFGVSPAFVVALLENLPAGVLRPYVCRVGGTFVGGMLTLELDETIYRWLGGAKHDADVPVNDLIDWHIIREAKSRDMTQYDLVSAYPPNIAKYKAKFAPDIRLYQQVEWGTSLMRMAANIYKHVKK